MVFDVIEGIVYLSAAVPSREHRADVVLTVSKDRQGKCSSPSRLSADNLQADPCIRLRVSVVGCGKRFTAEHLHHLCNPALWHGLPHTPDRKTGCWQPWCHAVSLGHRCMQCVPSNA